MSIRISRADLTRRGLLEAGMAAGALGLSGAVERRGACRTAGWFSRFLPDRIGVHSA